MEYSYLLDQADECEDPYMRLVYASEYSFYLFTYGARSALVLSWMAFMFLQRHGLFLFIMPTKGRGSHLILFLERLMNWLIIMESDLSQSR